jgi:hypothetical protein
MARAAQILSIVSLCAVVFAFSVNHWGFPPIGSEGTIFFGGLALWIGILGAFIAVCLSAALAYRNDARWRWSLGCAVLAGAAAVILVRIT